MLYNTKLLKERWIRPKQTKVQYTQKHGRSGRTLAKTHTYTYYINAHTFMLCCMTIWDRVISKKNIRTMTRAVQTWILFNRELTTVSTATKTSPCEYIHTRHTHTSHTIMAYSNNTPLQSSNSSRHSCKSTQKNMTTHTHTHTHCRSLTWAA